MTYNITYSVHTEAREAAARARLQHTRRAAKEKVAAMDQRVRREEEESYTIVHCYTFMLFYMI